MKEVEHERRDWIIILIILLFGFLCVLLAGNWALRFSPRWTLNTDMGSNLNPDSGLQGNRPNEVEVVEAIDPAVQTPPVWLGLYLTPGAVIPTRVPPTNTLVPTSAPTRAAPTQTNSPANTPTNTLVYFPATSTSTSKPVATKTFTPVSISTSTSTSAPTRTPTRMPTATNTPTRTPNYTATPTVTGTLSPTPTATNTSTATNTPTATNTSTPTKTFTPTNTPTSTPTNTSTATATNTPTNTPTFTPTSNAPDADLAVTISDVPASFTYLANTSITYSVVVSNNGPRIVTGAPVTISLSPYLQNVSWSCTGTASTSCGGNGSGSNNINDAVTLPNGESVTYTINATVVAEPSGTLDSTVTVDVPAGMNDPIPGNNSATDSDLPGEIGTAPDGNVHRLASGDSLVLGINLKVDGSADGWDLVYYELPYGTGVLLDWMEIEISQDGSKWYRIFYWGDNVADTNSIVDFTKLPPPSIAPYPPPDEPDQREIPGSSLYSSTGIAIDVDPLVPTGTYNFIRFYAPPGDTDGHNEIDALQILN